MAGRKNALEMEEVEAAIGQLLNQGVTLSELSLPKIRAITGRGSFDTIQTMKNYLLEGTPGSAPKLSAEELEERLTKLRIENAFLKSDVNTLRSQLDESVKNNFYKMIKIGLIKIKYDIDDELI